MAKGMNLLAMDTSTSRASVALSVRGQVWVEEEHNLREHARVLLLMVDRLLKKASLSIEQLDGIVFGAGPGSFTGIRIACSVAKGLAYAHDLPLYPVSGLRALAEEASARHLPVLAMMDARMKQVYWAFDALQDDAVLHVTDPEAVDIPDHMQCVLVGTDIKPYQAALKPALRECIVEQIEAWPRAETMIRMVEREDIASVSVDQAMPLYVRDQVTSGGRCGK